MVARDIALWFGIWDRLLMSMVRQITDGIAHDRFSCVGDDAGDLLAHISIIEDTDTARRMITKIIQPKNCW